MGSLISRSWESYESFITSLEVALRFIGRIVFMDLKTRGPLFRKRRLLPPAREDIQMLEILLLVGDI